MKQRMLSKGLAVAVILIFVGVGIQPAIATVETENIDTEYYDVNIEFCGLGKNITVQLTKQQLDELYLLFETIREQLNNTESIRETIKIYNEAIVELDNLGLLGGCSVKQVQELVTEGYQNPIVKSVIDEMNNKNSISLDDNENLFCLLVGKTDGPTCFQKPISTFFLYLAIFLYKLNLERLGSWFILFWMLSSIFVYETPIAFLLKIGLGIYSYGGPYRTPAKGWIITLGVNGKKSWNDSFYGQLSRFLGIPLPGIPNGGESYPAILGYTGIKLLSKDKIDNYYLGSAFWVKIGTEPPW